MKVEKTKLKDVLLITHDVFEDHRGEYIELYNKELLDKDVKLGNIKERCKEASYNYHNNLLQLMDMLVAFDYFSST